MVAFANLAESSADAEEGLRRLGAYVEEHAGG
jgi:hypothetical protein